MRVSSVVVVGFAGAALFTAASQAQSSLPGPLAQQIEEAEARVAQPAAQNDGVAWWELGRLEQDAARYGDAERCYARALSLLEGGDKAALANALDSAGTLYVETGEIAKAEPLEQRALALREAANDSLGEGRSWMHLAMLSLGRHDAGAAVHYARMAQQRLVDAKPGVAASPEEKMTALVDLALALCADGRCSHASAPLREAHRIAVANAGPAGAFPAGYIDFLRGYVDWQAGDAAEASGLMKSGIAAMEAELGFGHPTYVAALGAYRDFLEQTGDLAGAAEVRERMERMAPVQTASAVANGVR
ncbi:MAG TPA: tetratricopeptide repeat protein [Acidobacteriaceae bacterium]